MTDSVFKPLTVRRTTAETDFAIRIAPRLDAGPLLDLPNKLLAHFVDHFAKAASMNIELVSAKWPRSWEFDHVVCEDFGQLVGKGIAAIVDRRRASCGIPGRGSAFTSMDDAAGGVAVTFESRPRCTWQLPRRADVDGFVDAWYADGKPAAAAYGTNLRQFFDGFAYGSGATIVVELTAVGNLHHVYEILFRALGDAVGAALGTAQRLPGEGSGLAGPVKYDVREE
jgi:imidazoleglycerol-phosphate dehydratase